MCPECSTSLIVEGATCPDCGSPIFAFEVPPKGMVEGCTNRDCTWQRWAEVDESG